MKLIFTSIVFFFSYHNLLFADDIYLKNNTVIKYEILQITKSDIEYSDESENSFSIKANNNVIKVVFDNKETDQIQKDNSIPVSQTEPLENQTASRMENNITRKGGFIDSYIKLGFVYGLSLFTFGDLVNKEEAVYKENRHLITPDTNNDYSMSHYSHNGGFDIDFMFSAIKYSQIKGFSLSGIKLGIKSNYLFSEIYQDVYDSHNPRGTIELSIIEYRCINIGPEINFVFSPRFDLFDIVIQIYGLWGYIHNGKLTATPAIRKWIAIDRSEYSDKFDGYSIRAGAGIFIAFNRSFPGILGIDPYISYSKINFNNNVPIYNNAGTSSFYEIGVLLSFAVHY